MDRNIGSSFPTGPSESPHPAEKSPQMKIHDQLIKHHKQELLDKINKANEAFKKAHDQRTAAPNISSLKKFVTKLQDKAEGLSKSSNSSSSTSSSSTSDRTTVIGSTILPPSEQLAERAEAAAAARTTTTTTSSHPKPASLEPTPQRFLGIKPRTAPLSNEIVKLVHIKGQEYKPAHSTTKESINLAGEGLTSFTTGEKLGKGTYGKVIEINQNLAFKFARNKGIVKDVTEQYQAMGYVPGNIGEVIKERKVEAQKDVMKDFDNSHRINAKAEGDILGIKPPALFKVTMPRLTSFEPEVPSKHKPPRVGFMDIKYESKDLRDMLVDLQEAGQTLPLTNSLSIAYQLLFAGSFMQQHGILDGDRKDENILISEQDGVQLANFADWGSARFAEDLDQSTPLRDFGGVGVHTPQTTANKDREIVEGIVNRNEHKRFLDFEPKRLSFSLGVTLYSLLTSARDPYPLDDRAYLDVSESYIPISTYNPDVSPELEQFVQRLLDPDYRKRPTPTEAKEQFDTLLASSFPEVKHKIEGDIVKLGYVS